MKNRVFKVAICFALIFSLVFCEASMCFATTGTATPIAEENKAEVSSVVIKDHAFEEGEVYAYTGEKIRPVLTSVVADITYKNENGTSEVITKTITSFEKVTYENNVSIGTGHVITTIEGKAIQVPFEIKFGQVNGLKATSTSCSSIKLSWNNVPGAAGYVIYRADSGSKNFKKIKTISSGMTVSYSNSKLALGKTYSYKVQPYREVSGETVYGELSDQVSIKVKPPTPVISSVKRSTYNSLRISWKKVSGVSGYRIYRSTSANGDYKRIATVRGNKKFSYRDKKRSCGKRYYYIVRAYKTSKAKKHFSSSSEYKAGRTTPGKINFSKKSFSLYSSVELRWSKSKGASGYEIYCSESKDSGYVKVKTITSSKTTKWTNTGLDGTIKYYYRIRPYRVVGGTKVYGAYSSIYTKYVISKSLSTLIKKYEGVRYRYGGNTPKGWDCSGFVQWATYYLKGKKIGRTAGAQARGGKYVNKNKMSTWKPGDVLVYKRNGGGVSHVGLYIGGGKMMHALNSRYDTVIQDVSYYEKWDRGNYLAAVRRY